MACSRFICRVKLHEARRVGCSLVIDQNRFHCCYRDYRFIAIAIVRIWCVQTLMGDILFALIAGPYTTGTIAS